MDKFIAQVLVNVFSGLFGTFVILTILSFLAFGLEPTTLTLAGLGVFSRIMNKYKD